MALTVDANSFRTAPDAHCHLLPCTINKNGEANVQKFFETAVRKESDDGIVLREVGSAVTEDQDRLLRVDQRFSAFTAWNLDKTSSGDDKLNKAMQWIDIARTLHQPVDENSQKSITGK